MTTEGQRLIEGNQMLSFYLLRTHFLYEKKTVPSQHQQYKIIQKPENGKAVSMSYSNTMHTHT